MDIQRVAVWLGLAIVSYLLILAWNEDYHQQPDTPAEVVEEAPSDDDQPDMEAPEPETTDEEEFAVPDDGDEDLAAPEEEQDFEADMPADDAETVRVRTDVLDLEISLTGGHIVNAYLLQYESSLGSEEPLQLLQNDSRRTYILESSLIGRDGTHRSGRDSLPRYETDASDFELSDDEDSLHVDLYYQTDDGVEIRKRYTFKRDSYNPRVDYRIENNRDEDWVGNFSGKIVRDETSDPTGQSTMGIRAYLGMVLSTPDDAYTKYDFSDLNDSPLNMPVEGGWVAFLQHYFMSAWIPNPEQTHQYQTLKRGNLHVMGFVSPGVRVSPGETAETGAQFYLGPKIMDRLRDIAPHLHRTVDFGWLFFISTPLFHVLDWFENVVGNWGVAIILLTLMVKLLFFKLSAASYRSMANMRRVAPQLQRLRELYGDDKQKMSQEMMALYKKEKINPLGGCLPILVQMPVFIALYWVLFESVELRHAPFMLWIEDLSVMDPYFILPLLMGASMFLQMQLNPTPPDPVQARVMKLMPIIFTVFFLWFPAGLVLYWLTNNVLSIAQQFYITRKIEKEQGKVAKG